MQGIVKYANGTSMLFFDHSLLVICSCYCGLCFADGLTINCPTPTGRVFAPICDQKDSVIGLKDFVIKLKDFVIKSRDPVILRKNGRL